MLRRVWAVLVARNLEFLRDRSALAWNVLLPVLLIGGFAFAFSGEPPALYRVGVHATADAGDPALALRHLRFVEVEALAGAVQRVERHQLDLLLDYASGRYWVNEQSARGYIAERVVLGASERDWARQPVSGREVRYVDWVLPGVLGMNVMFSALFGVGYVIVRYRKNGVLKRLKATPLGAAEFLFAQVLSRLALILVVTAVVYAGTDVFVDFTMHGSYALLVLVVALGTACMISLGLVVAARLANEETASGLLNLISWPMMFLSGVWFSLEGVHPLLRAAAQLLPLTHVVDAGRAVMIDGAGLVDIAPQLAVLGGMTAALLLLGARLFRWQ